MKKSNKSVLLIISVCLTLLLVFSIVSCVPGLSGRTDREEEKKAFEIEQSDEQSVNSKARKIDINSGYVVYETQDFAVRYPETESDFEILVDSVKKADDGKVFVCVITSPNVCVCFNSEGKRITCDASENGIATVSFSPEELKNEFSIYAKNSDGQITPEIYLKILNV